MRGVSLVELLVAVAIGMVLIAGALAVFVDSRQTARVTRSLARIEEHGLFAADEISRSLELAGYWGQNNNTSLVQGRTERSSGAVSSASTLTGATSNCTSADGYEWYTDLQRPIEGLDTDGSTADANDGSSYGTCIPDTTYNRISEGPFGASDILIVRYVDPTAIATLQANTVYVRSDPKQSQIFIGTTQPTGFSTSANNYRLRAYAYYVSKYYETPGDGIPTLKRASLEAGPAIIPGSTNPQQEDIVMPGVESLHVQFGVDTTGDGSANQYVNAGTVAATQWDNVVSVRFWLIVRAEASEANYANPGTYRLPQADVTPGDAFRRVRITRTVQVRNIERT